MPRFLYSVVFLSFFSGGALLYTLLNKSPQEHTNVVILLSSLFLFLTAISSLCLYFVSSRKLTEEKQQRLAYRKALKKAVMVNLYILALLVLKYFELLSLTTGGLFTVLYVFGNYFLRGTSKH